MKRRMTERLRCGKGTKIHVSNIPSWLLQWKGQGLVAPWRMCSFSNQGAVVVEGVCAMNPVSFCLHK